MLSLAWRTAEYEISGIKYARMVNSTFEGQCQLRTLVSQSHYTGPLCSTTNHNRGTKQSKAPARGTCKLNEAQSYCITPTILTRKILLWSHKYTFHFFEPSKLSKATYTKQKSRQQQESNDRWFETACCCISNCADWASQAFKWSKPTQFIPGGSACCRVKTHLAQPSPGKLRQVPAQHPYSKITAISCVNLNQNDKAWQNPTTVGNFWKKPLVAHGCHLSAAAC